MSEPTVGRKGSVAWATNSSSIKTQSAVDGELVEDIVERVVEHVYQNTVLMKYRLLQHHGVDLLPIEQESLVKGEDANAERRSVFTEELGMLRDAVMQHFYPSRRAQWMGANANGSLRGSGLEGPNAYLIKQPKSSLSDILRDEIDSLFQRSYEETALRLATRQEELEERIGPNRRLNTAIALQRERMQKVTTENEHLVDHVKVLEARIASMTASHERKEKYHKDQLNAFLKEVGILKEQLYRTYRDKNYVGKDVDLMLTVVDDDTCEDVSVDQLLAYRRTMRGVEHQTALLKAKIKALEEDVEARDSAMVQLEERQRARELSVMNAQQELDDMNRIVMKLEGEKIDAHREIKALKDEIYHLKNDVPETRAVASQATEEEDRARAQEYLHIETNVALSEEKRDSLLMFDKLVTVRIRLEDELRLQQETARKERVALELKIKDLEYRLEYAERRQADLRQISENAIVRQQTAEAHAAEVANAAAGQAATLASELKTAQDEVEALRAQNATLCLAYTGMWERLQAVKTKAGLNDYKRRSNEHHLQRANAVIEAANQRIEAAEARCAEAVRQAEERVLLAESNLNFSLEDHRCLKRRHAEDIQKLALRIRSVEEASRALLDDYNRLRSEHLKLTAQSALERDAESDLIQRASERLGSGGGTRSSMRRRSSLSVDDKANPRQSFAFEALTDPGASEMSLIAKVEAAAEALELRRGSASEVAEFGGRKLKPSQLVTMLAREYENALLCSFFPLLETIAACVEADADLARRAASAESRGVAGGAAGNAGASDPVTLRSASVQDYMKLIATKDDDELRAMGLSEQRELVAWNKVRLVANVERELRTCLKRLHRAATEAKTAPLDTAPLPADVSAEVEALQAKVRAAQVEQEQWKTKEVSAALTTASQGEHTSLSVPSAAPMQGQQSKLAKKPHHASASTSRAQTPVTPRSRSNASTPAHSVAPAAFPRAPSPSTPRQLDIDTTVAHAASSGSPTHSAQLEVPSSNVAPLHKAVSVVTQGTQTQSQPPSSTAGGQRGRSDDPVLMPPLGALALPDDDTLLPLPRATQAERKKLARPSSTGGSPRSQRATQHLRLQQNVPHPHLILPTLRHAPAVAAVATECFRVGATLASDASLVTDEEILRVPPLALRSAGAVEHDSEQFGNKLSVNKEYEALKARLARAVESTMPAPPLADTVTSGAAATGAGATPVPRWKAFKAQRQQQQTKQHSRGADTTK